MRAARIIPGPQGGAVEVRDEPVPVPGEGHVLVRVMTSGLNRGEVGQVARATTGAPLPIGVEFAGTVEAVGGGVTEWAPGDRAMGHGLGGQAEFVIAASRALIPVPDGMSWVSAAAFPNVFVTAHDALVTNGRLQAGEVVMVNAASSGIGQAAIQIAKALGAGAVIATTRSPEKATRLHEAGVDLVIDTSREATPDVVAEFTDDRGADIIIDSVGGSVFEDNLRALGVQGRLVNIGRLGGSVAQIDLEQLWLKRLHLIGVTFRTRSEEERLACVEACAADLLEPLSDGKLAMPIDRTFPLDEIAAAHDYMLRDQHFGKIVMVIDRELQAQLEQETTEVTA